MGKRGVESELAKALLGADSKNLKMRRLPPTGSPPALMFLYDVFA
jgi:hypothetical protein